jgi:membrane protease YdiL (CAAX protease family)
MLLCWLWYRSGRSAIAPTLFHAAFNTVATAYFLAATDWRITLLLAAALAGAALIDPRPDRNAER